MISSIIFNELVKWHECCFHGSQLISLEVIFKHSADGIVYNLMDSYEETILLLVKEE